MSKKLRDLKPVIIFGASGHAKVVIDIIEKSNEYSILGLLDTYRSVGDSIFGYKILGDIGVLPKIVEEFPHCSIFVAVGDNWIRSLIVKKIVHVSPDINFISIIHPNAQIGKGVKIGKGTAIMPGVIIDSDSSIGDFCIVNTGSIICHESRLNNFSSLAPNVTLGGNVEIGLFSAISISVSVIHGIKIGQHSVIGASSLVMEDCSDLQVIYGSPAKMIRLREIGEIYL